MTSLMRRIVVSLVVAVLWAPLSAADSVDTYIQQLKDRAPEVRIKAAQELADG